MRPNELVVGGYYVREERSLILHFYSAGTDGLARYHGYDLKDGKFRHTGSCELGTMMQWANRKATTEDISRVQPREPVIEVFERHGSPSGEHLNRRVAHDMIDVKPLPVLVVDNIHEILSFPTVFRQK